MIGEIIKLVKIDNWHGISETVDIAKGKYEIPDAWSEFKDKIKREIKWQLRNR